MTRTAYAVSIHKAQGLEYDSVKIVITEANEDDITHSIFYTAVTRARESLKIFWTPETQHSVLMSLQRSTNPKDVALLSSRRGLRVGPLVDERAMPDEGIFGHPENPITADHRKGNPV